MVIDSIVNGFVPVIREFVFKSIQSSVPSKYICAFESNDTLDKFIVELPTKGNKEPDTLREVCVNGVLCGKNSTWGFLYKIYPVFPNLPPHPPGYKNIAWVPLPPVGPEVKNLE